MDLLYDVFIIKPVAKYYYMDTKFKIAICGDSWAMGEFTKANKYFVKCSYGLPTMLEQAGFTVLDRTNTGQSPQQCLDLLLRGTPELSPDLIIWFDTDPLRELRGNDSVALKVLANQSIFESWWRFYLRKIYQDLNKLNIPVWIIGASVDHSLAISKGLDNLKPVIPSLKTWLDDSYSHEVNYGYSLLTVRKLADLKIGLRVKDSILTNCLAMANYMESSDLYPDGMHPNKQCHQRLSDYLVGLINEQFFAQGTVEVSMSPAS